MATPTVIFQRNYNEVKKALGKGKNNLQKSEGGNLVPFPKGVGGNPNGRPKGGKNRNTLVKYWLGTLENHYNPISKEMEILDQYDIIILAMINQARKGNVTAFRELMDSVFGKLQDSLSVDAEVDNHVQIEIISSKIHRHLNSNGKNK